MVILQLPMLMKGGWKVAILVTFLELSKRGSVRIFGSASSLLMESIESKTYKANEEKYNWLELTSILSDIEVQLTNNDLMTLKNIMTKSVSGFVHETDLVDCLADINE